MTRQYQVPEFVNEYVQLVPEIQPDVYVGNVKPGVCEYWTRYSTGSPSGDKTEFHSSVTDVGRLITIISVPSINSGAGGGGGVVRTKESAVDHSAVASESVCTASLAITRQYQVLSVSRLTSQLNTEIQPDSTGERNIEESDTWP